MERPSAKNALSMKVKKLLDNYYFIYTIAFALLSVFIFSFYYLNNKSLIWDADGIKQHYNTFVYWGRYLKSIAENFFHTGNLDIPMYDFTLGYGADVLTTLHYYVIGDPLNLIAAFTPIACMETVFCFLIVLRLYLSGITFSLFCKRFECQQAPMLIGALIYVFSGYALKAAVFHPFFLNPMIYFPLLLLGAEKVLNSEKPYLLIFSVFLSAISNFYFFYMLVIAVVIYVAVRLFKVDWLKSKAYRKSTLSKIFRLFCFSLIGVLLSCCIFYPVVLRFMSSSRTMVEYTFPLTYSSDYYRKILAAFTSAISADVSSWSTMGYTAVALICLFTLFITKNKYKSLRYGLVICFVFLLFPFFGHVMNGFSYAINRWIWALAFLIGFMVAVTLPMLLELSEKELSRLNGLCIIYFAYIILLPESRGKASLTSCCFMFLIMAIINSKFWVPEKAANTILLITVVSLMINAVYCYSPTESDSVDGHVESGEANKTLEDASIAVKSIKDESPFFRYDENIYSQESLRNSGLFNRLKSCNYYYSLENPYISDYYEELGINNYALAVYTGVDNRTPLTALASTKYFQVTPENKQYLPYGYNKKAASYEVDDDTVYDIYENEYALPLGFTYDSYIPDYEYQGLNELERQQALLQGVVLKKNAGISLEKADLKLDNTNVEYSLKAGNGVLVEQNKFIVTEPDSKATLYFQTPEDTESYISFTNLTYAPRSQFEYYKISEEHIEETKIEQYRSRLEYDRPVAQKAVLRIRGQGFNKPLYLTTSDYRWHTGRENFVINLNYHKKSMGKLRITFPETGEYSYDDIKITSISYDDYPETIGKLKEHVLEDIEVGNNSVTGSISVDKPEMLFLSIPFEKGWTAYVNGEETELLQANTMYMALPLEAGESKIELRYRTPGLTTGLKLTFIGIVFLLLIFIYQKTWKSLNDSVSRGIRKKGKGK